MSSTTILTTESSSSSDKFVNEGLERWKKTRSQWLTPSTLSEDTSTILKKFPSHGEVKARTVDMDNVIERVLGQGGDGQLREPIPLGQMIDILIDFWEADGLYD